ncbi:hypothetical protein BC835DRAFT_1420287 [Cytidiella melzeri]|nr:hypothetical protein BC835DRAFT_1420287 [Cytidiella melzeri]
MAPPHEKKSTQKSLTPAEKQARSQQRKEKNFCMNQKLDNALSEVWKLAEALHKDLGTNSVKYWYERLLQQSSKQRQSRQTSRWNAFLSKETRARNETLPPGAPRPKVHDFAPQICNLWKAMSKQEQVAATEEELVQIAGVKEMKKTASHSVALNAFHDARALLASVQSQMESLHNRTGLEMLLLAVRADAQNVSCPQIMRLGSNATVSVVSKSKLITKKLHEAVAPCSVSKMFYTNFDMHITEKYGIVVVNWPLPQFVAPGSIDSRLELQTLYNAWLSGSTHFRCLSPSETETWMQQRFSTQVAAALATSPPVDQGTPDNSSSGTPADAPALLPDTSSTMPASSSTTSVPATSQGTSDLHATLTAMPQTGIFMVSGAPLVTQKPRKQRSDKGKKRGPKTKGPTQTEITPSASD